MFKDILTFLGLDYIYALLITFYFVVIQKSDQSHRNLFFKKYGHSGNDNRIAIIEALLKREPDRFSG